MEKIDLKKTLASYKAKHGKFEIIDVPEYQYLMIDGHGDPNTSQEFKSAISTLYPLSYKIKFASKQTFGKDYTVAPLEALWWAEDMESFSNARDKSKWDFTVMIMQPGWITPEMFEEAKQKVTEKDPNLDLTKVRLEKLDEGKCVQTLHVGSFDDEGPVIDQIHHEFIPSNGLKMVKKHHEIYLNDFRKVEPAKLKTILRQPVAG